MNKPTYQQLITMDITELNDWLFRAFPCEVPTCIDSLDEFVRAGNLLGELTNKYTYLASILSFLRIEVKNEKRKNSKSKEAEEMLIRRDSVQLVFDVVKQQYSAVSRIITVKQEINNELKMLGNIP